MVAHERDDAPAGLVISLGERLASLERTVTCQREELAAQREALAAQRERVDRQEAEIARLRAEHIASAASASTAPAPLPLRAYGAADEDAQCADTTGAGGSRRASRRNLLRLGGAAAAAGVAAGAIELWRPGAAHAAPRNDNDTMIIGKFANESTNTTWLINDTSGNDRVMVLLDESPSPFSSPNGYTSGLTSRSVKDIGVLGVFGLSEVPSPPTNLLAANLVGVYGLANTTPYGGYGVVAHSIGGFAPLLIVPSGTAGATDKSLAIDGAIWADSTGAVWNARSGAWCPLSSVNLLPVPIRLLDTRAGAPAGSAHLLTGTPVAYHGTQNVPVTGFTFAGQTIPAAATAVFGTLTAALGPGVNSGDGSSAICWATGSPRPVAVNVVFNPQDLHGAYTSTFTLVGIGAGGAISIYSQPINAGVAVDYIFDAFGFVM